jgi:hypothetical protein
MYTTPADAALRYSWNDGSATTDNTMGNCTASEPRCDRGESNTALLVGLGTTPSPAPYDAARYCDGLSAHSETDWYLPAKNELNILHDNRVAIGGFFPGSLFPDSFYWSSSENTNANSWALDFGLVSPDIARVKSNVLKVRCVRKVSSSLNWSNWGG